MLPNYDSWKERAPEPVGPCPRCRADEAAQHVRDCIYDITESAFPAEAIGEWQSRFGETIADMVGFARDREDEAARRGDWTYCDKHTPECD